ncbi:MAG: DUF983 domain-containing protein [Devosiaceae bacterium]|nr:DUF983 domain-containing protein [Devosiaceae bacterium]
MSISHLADSNDDPATKRALKPAMLRGLRGKCPKCGKGKMFRAYLKVADACSKCAENLSHHRADDAPPYIIILLVGHILVGLMLHLEMAWRIPPMVYIYSLVPLAVILPLLLLPPVKGAIVGLQWANKMHGFDPDKVDEFL